MAMSYSKITVYHTSPDHIVHNEVFYTSLNASMSSDTATAVINWAENFVNLTEETYEQCKIVQAKSLIEILTDNE